MQNEHAPTTTDDAGEIFEVFQQDLRKDEAPHHGGNLRAPDAELACHYAREFYGRRQESDRLWVIPRHQIWEISPPYPGEDAEEDESHPLTATAAEDTLYEAQLALFGQTQAGKAFIWICDLPEPMHPAALSLATLKNYMKDCQYSYLRFWFCPRDAILEVDSPDLLHPPLDRSYRRLDGYNIRDKLREARQRTLQEQAQAQPQTQQPWEPLQKQSGEQA